MCPVVSQGKEDPPLACICLGWGVGQGLLSICRVLSRWGGWSPIPAGFPPFPKQGAPCPHMRAWWSALGPGPVWALAVLCRWIAERQAEGQTCGFPRPPTFSHVPGVLLVSVPEGTQPPPRGSAPSASSQVGTGCRCNKTSLQQRAGAAPVPAPRGWPEGPAARQDREHPHCMRMSPGCPPRPALAHQSPQSPLEGHPLPSSGPRDGLPRGWQLWGPGVGRPAALTVLPCPSPPCSGRSGGLRGSSRSHSPHWHISRLFNRRVLSGTRRGDTVRCLPCPNAVMGGAWTPEGPWTGFAGERGVR